MKKLQELDDVNVNENVKFDLYMDEENIDINIVEWNQNKTDMIMDEMLYTGKYTEKNEIKAREILKELEQDIQEYM